MYLGHTGSDDFGHFGPRQDTEIRQNGGNLLTGSLWRLPLYGFHLHSPLLVLHSFGTGGSSFSACWISLAASILKWNAAAVFTPIPTYLSGTAILYDGGPVIIMCITHSGSVSAAAKLDPLHRIRCRFPLCTFIIGHQSYFVDRSCSATGIFRSGSGSCCKTVNFCTFITAKIS